MTILITMKNMQMNIAVPDTEEMVLITMMLNIQMITLIVISITIDKKLHS